MRLRGQLEVGLEQRQGADDEDDAARQQRRDTRLDDEEQRNADQNAGKHAHQDGREAKQTFRRAAALERLRDVAQHEGHREQHHRRSQVDEHRDERQRDGRQADAENTLEHSRKDQADHDRGHERGRSSRDDVYKHGWVLFVSHATPRGSATH